MGASSQTGVLPTGKLDSAPANTVTVFNADTYEIFPGHRADFVVALSGTGRSAGIGQVRWLEKLGLHLSGWIKIFTGNGIANPMDIFFEGIELTTPIDSLILLRL
jgi:hypothetical protein